MNLLHKAPTRFDSDGLSSLEYTKLAFELKRLYTWILIEVDKDAVIEVGIVSLALALAPVSS